MNYKTKKGYISIEAIIVFALILAVMGCMITPIITKASSSNDGVNESFENHQNGIVNDSVDGSNGNNKDEIEVPTYETVNELAVAALDAIKESPVTVAYFEERSGAYTQATIDSEANHNDTPFARKINAELNKIGINANLYSYRVYRKTDGAGNASIYKMYWSMVNISLMNEGDEFSLIRYDVLTGKFHKGTGIVGKSDYGFHIIKANESSFNTEIFRK